MKTEAICHCGARMQNCNSGDTRIAVCPVCGKAMDSGAARSAHNPPEIARTEASIRHCYDERVTAPSSRVVQSMGGSSASELGGTRITAERIGTALKQVVGNIIVRCRPAAKCAIRRSTFAAAEARRWIRPKLMTAMSFVRHEVRLLMSLRTLGAVKAFSVDLRQRPLASVASALSQPRVLGWIGLAILLFALLGLYSRHTRDNPTDTAIAQMPGKAVRTPPIRNTVQGSAQAPADVHRDQASVAPGESHEPPASRSTQTEATLLDRAVPIDLRSARDEYIVAYEILTGKAWKGSIDELQQWAFGIQAPDSDRRPDDIPLPISGSTIPEQYRAIHISGGRVTGMNFSGVPLDDGRLSRLKSLAGLTSISFAGANLDAVTETGIAAIADCRSLQSVDLHGQAISDEYLTYIGKCSELTSLNLRGTRVTDAGMRELHNSKLRRLDVSGTKVTEIGIAELGKLTALDDLAFKDCAVRNWSYLKHFKNLEHLKDFGMILPVSWKPAASRSASYLGGTVTGYWRYTWTQSPELYSPRRPTTPPVEFGHMANQTPPVEGRQILEAIQNMTQLREVELCFARCVDDDLKLLARLEQLQTLDLSWSEVTGAGLDHLMGLKNLRNLNLSHTPLRFEDLRMLKRMPSLREVGVNRTRLTKAQIQKLEEEMPRVKFWFEKLEPF